MLAGSNIYQKGDANVELLQKRFRTVNSTPLSPLSLSQP